MKYIAKNLKKGKFEIMGLLEKETITGEKVEVIIDRKVYDKKNLEETILAYSLERDEVVNKYNKDIEDMNSMLEAMVISK